MNVKNVDQGIAFTLDKDNDGLFAGTVFIKLSNFQSKFNVVNTTTWVPAVCEADDEVTVLGPATVATVDPFILDNPFKVLALAQTFYDKLYFVCAGEPIEMVPRTVPKLKQDVILVFNEWLRAQHCHTVLNALDCWKCVFQLASKNDDAQFDGCHTIRITWKSV